MAKKGAEEQVSYDSYYNDVAFRIRDVEEKQQLLKDRLLLISQTLVDEREKSFSEIQEMKRMLIKLGEESERMQEFLQRITEQLSSMARREELMILQRQFDLFREH